LLLKEHLEKEGWWNKLPVKGKLRNLQIWLRLQIIKNNKGKLDPVSKQLLEDIGVKFNSLCSQEESGWDSPEVARKLFEEVKENLNCLKKEAEWDPQDKAELESQEEKGWDSLLAEDIVRPFLSGYCQ